MVAMNAGVKDKEIFNIIKRIKIGSKWIDKEQIDYGYRYAKLGGIATEVELEVKRGFNKILQDELNALRANQPKEPSAGSCFKNPDGDYAGRLIEAVGLKGKRVGNMAFSEVHANFLVNLGGGEFEDAIYLIELAKERIYKEFGVALVEEIKIV
jgi:UDP-N-acetylmuramate dehydrogenase